VDFVARPASSDLADFKVNRGSRVFRAEAEAWERRAREVREA